MSIVISVSKIVEQMFETHLPENFFFHNISHTKEVVKASLDIGQAVHLSNEELETAQLAAWFHDTGYCYTYEGHEEISGEIAIVELGKLDYPEKKIESILSCIDSTKMPQQPKKLIEMVVCDADFYHLSSPNYSLCEKQLRKEWQNLLGKIYSDQEWTKLNCTLMLEHKYFTTYGQMVLQPNKDQNIQGLKSVVL